MWHLDGSDPDLCALRPNERGDTVLRDASRFLRRSVRDVDICARYGGEEFAILVPEADRTIAGRVARRLLSDLRKASLELPDGRVVNVTASFE